MENEVVIRLGKKEDLPRVHELVVELAIFERAGGEVTNTVAQMEIDGFGSNPLYGFFVAEDLDGIQGLSLYYYRYSTWKGKRLYLEDIIVTESKRGSGIGKRLFEVTMQKSLDDDCSGMVWQVLDWNEPAIVFYKKYGGKVGDGFTNCSLDKEQIEQFFQTAKS